MAGPTGPNNKTAPYADTYSGTKPVVIAPTTLLVKTINPSHAKPGPRVASYADSFSE